MATYSSNAAYFAAHPLQSISHPTQKTTNNKGEGSGGSNNHPQGTYANVYTNPSTQQTITPSLIPASADTSQNSKGNQSFSDNGFYATMGANFGSGNAQLVNYNIPAKSGEQKSLENNFTPIPKGYSLGGGRGPVSKPDTSGVVNKILSNGFVQAEANAVPQAVSYLGGGIKSAGEFLTKASNNFDASRFSPQAQQVLANKPSTILSNAASATSSYTGAVIYGVGSELQQHPYKSIVTTEAAFVGGELLGSAYVTGRNALVAKNIAKYGIDTGVKTLGANAFAEKVASGALIAVSAKSVYDTPPEQTGRSLVPTVAFGVGFGGAFKESKISDVSYKFTEQLGTKRDYGISQESFLKRVTDNSLSSGQRTIMSGPSVTRGSFSASLGGVPIEGDVIATKSFSVSSTGHGYLLGESKTTIRAVADTVKGKSVNPSIIKSISSVESNKLIVYPAEGYIVETPSVAKSFSSDTTSYTFYQKSSEQYLSELRNPVKRSTVNYLGTDYIKSSRTSVSGSIQRTDITQFKEGQFFSQESVLSQELLRQNRVKRVTKEDNLFIDRQISNKLLVKQSGTGNFFEKEPISASNKVVSPSDQRVVQAFRDMGIPVEKDFKPFIDEKSYVNKPETVFKEKPLPKSLVDSKGKTVINIDNTGKGYSSKILQKSQQQSISTYLGSTKADIMNIGTKVSTTSRFKLLPGVTSIPVIKSASKINVISTQSQIPQESQITKQSQISSVTQIPTQRQIPSVTQIPTQRQIPSVAQVPRLSQIPSQSQIPQQSQIPKQSQIPSATYIPHDNPLPKEFPLLPGGGFIGGGSKGKGLKDKFKGKYVSSFSARFAGQTRGTGSKINTGKTRRKTGGYTGLENRR